MKKAKIIVFLLMILTSIFPLGIRIINLVYFATGIGVPIKNGVVTTTTISGADGPTSIFITTGTPYIMATLIPAGVLFILWLILHILSRLKKEGKS